MNSNQIKRSLYYYEWFTHSYNHETNTVCIDKTSRKIIEFLTDLYNKQLKSDSYTDYMVHTSQGDEFIIIDSKDDKQICFRIALRRDNALPYVEKDGKLEELGSVISEDQNLTEVTHCVFFTEYGILGAEYNNNGARATSVSDYMVKITGTDSLPNCRVKLNYDAYSKLIRDETFTLFDFAVRTNSEAYNRVLSSKSIFQVIQATVPESDTMEVVLRRRKTKKNNQVGFSLPLSFEDIRNLLTNYRDDIKRFNVSQYGMNESIDLLSDKFVGKVSMAKTANRTIDSEAMYISISDYFNSDVEQYCLKQEG